MVIRSARAASVRLLGVSNGGAWEIARWGTTDQNGVDNESKAYEGNGSGGQAAVRGDAVAPQFDDRGA